MIDTTKLTQEGELEANMEIDLLSSFDCPYIVGYYG